MTVVAKRTLGSSCAADGRKPVTLQYGKFAKERHVRSSLSGRSDLLCRMVGRLVSAGLRLSFLRLAEDERQLPCGDNFKKYVVHLDSGFAIHCTVLVRHGSYRGTGAGAAGGRSSIT